MWATTIESGRRAGQRATPWAILIAAATLSGCGVTAVTSGTTTPTIPAPVTVPRTTAGVPTATVATTGAPATTAATTPPTTEAQTESTSIATPPPGTEPIQGNRGGSNTSSARVVTNGDWANATYPVDCLDSAPGPVVLVNGRQDGNGSNSEVYAELASTVDAGGGNTVVWLFCEASSRVNGYHAVLVGRDDQLLDDLFVGPVEDLDGLYFTTPLYEDWQVGELSTDAASSQVHNVGVSGSRLTLNDGAVTPKCAPIGPERFDYGPGRLNQGNLVRQFQARLIELGYGAEINASGGADGFIGRGTMEAFNRYFADNFDYNDFNSPASWLGNEDGVAWVNWLSVGWTRVLGLNCSGEYQPPGD